MPPGITLLSLLQFAVHDHIQYDETKSEHFNSLAIEKGEAAPAVLTTQQSEYAATA